MKDALPAVVRIETDKEQGTGFFVADNGTILTSAHVVDGATKIDVHLSTGLVVEGAVVGEIDRVVDLALLKVGVQKNRFLIIRHDTPPEVGLPIRVIGSPLGLDQTVSTGVISALRQSD